MFPQIHSGRKKTFLSTPPNDNDNEINTNTNLKRIAIYIHISEPEETYVNCQDHLTLIDSLTPETTIALNSSTFRSYAKCIPKLYDDANNDEEDYNYHERISCYTHFSLYKTRCSLQA